MVGKKRASPGAEEEKELDITLTEEMTDKLKDMSRLQLKAELALGSSVILILSLARGSDSYCDAVRHMKW